ncbi:hypothetical protein HOO54_20985 [Bacillus sp. WMMC1349]|uniref:hypothetical protein n=1 Tax=Bacillus sp. WMMC1349 TaxID=2736254 RepID=UPI0015551410|nr:hypothetical protein [Bacillus sp. WMMC1349]NPC94633.1 hypothetical protein [Bacillus sp. WMMC1349]
MKTLKLSIEELIFCFYSEGLFEQGMSLKQAYFPEMTEKQLESVFEISCRSLLAKDVLEYKNHQYQLKETFRPFIQVMNHADYTVKAAKFTDKGEESISYHIAASGVFAHSLCYDQQVHQISCLSSREEVIDLIVQFLTIKERSEKITFTLQHDQFEQLLKEASEEQVTVDDALVKWENKNPHAASLFQDLVSRQGKMDSIMLIEYDRDNTPDVKNILFVIPGSDHTWLAMASARNEFSIMSAENENLRHIIDRKSHFSR